MFVIENDKCKAKIKARGAELCSFIRKEDEKEYIWQADPKYWNRHAPTLFPIVGTLNPERGIKMGRHGFARDMEFTCIDHKKDKISLELLSTDQTRAMYPYDFKLIISYELEGTSVKIAYFVENKGGQSMPFSIGAHPAFPCDLGGGCVVLEFEQEEDLSCLTLDLEKGLLDGKAYEIPMRGRELPLTLNTFDKDALVFKGLKSNWIKLKDTSSNFELKVNFEGFPYMGIWSPGAPFICIEPWYGVTDNLRDAGPLYNKEGIINLEVNGAFRAEHKITMIS